MGANRFSPTFRVWPDPTSCSRRPAEHRFRLFSRAKTTLDAAITKANDDVPIAPWRIHDLRRTFANGNGELGVQLPVVEKLLNHVSARLAASPGSINGMTSPTKSARHWKPGRSICS